jgi:hypothetical protein
MITQMRVLIMEKLEGKLTQWMGYKYQCTITLSVVIQAKAKNLFDELNASEPDPKVPVFAPVLDDSDILKDAWIPQP